MFLFHLLMVNAGRYNTKYTYKIMKKKNCRANQDGYSNIRLNSKILLISINSFCKILKPATFFNIKNLLFILILYSPQSTCSYRFSIIGAARLTWVG